MLPATGMNGGARSYGTERTMGRLGVNSQQQAIFGLHFCKNNVEGYVKLISGDRAIDPEGL